MRAIFELYPQFWAVPPADVVALRAAEALLARASPTDLAWLDPRYRTIARRDHHPESILAFDSFHPDGRVRERAVALYAEKHDGSELPYLVIRANDWVETIRQAAARALLDRVESSYAPHWARCLALLEQMRDESRREPARYLVEVDALLRAPEHRAVLTEALEHGERRVRRAALHLALALPDAERRPLARLALHDADPIVAVHAAEVLLSERAALLAHPFSRIRRLGLEAALREGDASLEALLQRAVFDDARRIRELARHALSKSVAAPPDFAAKYRAALDSASEATQLVALEGLAEVGTEEDEPTFARFFRDPRGRARAAAIVGLGRCAGERHHDELSSALVDPSSIVRRAAEPYAKLRLGRAPVRALRRRG